ncbi:MAG: GTPase, partial [Gemmatimonadaceae bacterium]
QTLGGVAGGLLGGLLGGAAGIAVGAAITFASTYALGHVAEQYYAQGRQLSAGDLKALFTRFQGEANDLYPRVEQRIRDLASGNGFDSVLRTIRGT